MLEQIREGSMVFVADGEDGIGAVREIHHDTSELVIFIENGGDFVIPASAVRAVHSDKVVLDLDKLNRDVREAIGHARDSEDPLYSAPGSAEDPDE